jgi:hypothetical protein
MRLRTAILAALGLEVLVILALTATIREPDSVTAKVIVAQNQEAPAAVPAEAPVADTFYVNFEIIVYQEEIDEYPVTWENLQSALAEWSTKLLIRWVILIDDLSRGFSIEDRQGAIQIHMGDLQGDGYNLPEKLLGLWQPRQGRILLDADHLETNPERAYSVSLHELGHMFGVPHVISFSEMGYTGFLVLPMGVDATNYVMYPRAVVEHPQKQLSPIEIKIARNNVLYHWTRPDVTYKEHDCELYTED